MDASKLPNCLRKYADLIEEISDKRENGDGYWVYPVAGLIEPEMETHCIHESSPRACIAGLKRLVKCDCAPIDLTQRPPRAAIPGKFLASPGPATQHLKE
jgi:hypothetical protein